MATSSAIYHPSVRLRRTTAACLAVGVSCTAVWLSVSPRDGLLPECLVHQLTGLLCPGCGAVRAVWDALHGDLVSAARSHLLIVSIGPVWIIAGAIWIVRRWRGKDISVSEAWTTIAVILLTLVLFTAFTIARNQEWGLWLRPL